MFNRFTSHPVTPHSEWLTSKRVVRLAEQYLPLDYTLGLRVGPCKRTVRLGVFVASEANLRNTKASVFRLITCGLIFRISVSTK